MQNVFPLKKKYRIAAKCICILNPLGDSKNINLTFYVKSITELKDSRSLPNLKSNHIGKAYVDLFIYNEDLSNVTKKTRILIEDPDELVEDLQGWVPQIITKLENKITCEINDDNAINMIDTLFDFRMLIMDSIMNKEIQTN